MPSSVVSSIHYDTGSLTLRIVYVSGAVYLYKGVPPEEFQAMKNAGSKGVYLNRHIKPKYLFERLK